MNDMQAEKYTDLLYDNDRLIKSAKRSEKAVSYLTILITLLNDEVASLNHHLDMKDSRIETLRKDVDLWDRAEKELQSEITHLKGELENADDNIDLMDKELDPLKKKVEEQEESFNRCKVTLIASNNNAKDLKEIVDSKNKYAITLELRIASLEKEIKMLSDGA